MDELQPKSTLKQEDLVAGLCSDWESLQLLSATAAHVPQSQSSYNASRSVTRVLRIIIIYVCMIPFFFP